MDLNTTWFILVGLLLTGYAVLDGFDLGVGVVHLFTRDEGERLAHFRAIGPVWDGNEVWLITGGGALFAAFPPVYATVFSGFYLALMVVLLALILRAVAIEFRGAVDAEPWRRAWDFAFGIGSLLAGLLFGVAAGNILRGVPIGADGTYAGTFFGLLNPYALLVGLSCLAFFTMHGALYLRVKTIGVTAERMGRWAFRAWVVFLVLYLGATGASIAAAPHLFQGVFARPPIYLFLALMAAGIVGVPLGLRRGSERLPFMASVATVVAMCGLAGTSLYPRLVPSLIGLEHSLTAYNASSSPLTLTVMLVIALVGMPLVIGYTTVVYRIFRGKVTTDGPAASGGHY